MTWWQEHKGKLGTTRPWDFVNPNTEYSSDEEAVRRISICEGCPSFIKLTHQCKECGCFMKIKVWLKDAECPIKKW